MSSQGKSGKPTDSDSPPATSDPDTYFLPHKGSKGCGLVILHSADDPYILRPRGTKPRPRRDNHYRLNEKIRLMGRDVLNEHGFGHIHPLQLMAQGFKIVNNKIELIETDKGGEETAESDQGKLN